MNKKTYLLVGGMGILGQAIHSFLIEKDQNSILTSSSDRENTIKLDLLDRNSIEQAIDQIPNIDGLILAAGYEPQNSLKEMTAEHMDTMFGIHVTGPMWLIKKLQDKFNPGASIILISSVAAYKGSYDPCYATVKGATNALTRTLARELSPNVRVNAIAPSLVSGSPVFERMTPDFREKHLNATLNKRFLKPEECAHTAWFLINNDHITGQIIHLNGGQYFGH